MPARSAGRSGLGGDAARQSVPPPGSLPSSICGWRACAGWLALQDTDLAHATCGSLCLKRLKRGARVMLSVRRIKLATAYPYSGYMDHGVLPPTAPGSSRPPLLGRKRFSRGKALTRPLAGRRHRPCGTSHRATRSPRLRRVTSRPGPTLHDGIPFPARPGMPGYRGTPGRFEKCGLTAGKTRP